jgi:anti-sigma factor RsiW
MASLSEHDLTAAYVLDALDAREVEEYEEHLATCEQCRADLAALSVPASALAFAVESPAPPPELRGRLLEAARAERPNVVPLRSRWSTAVGVVVAVAAAAVAVGIGIWAVALHRSLDHERNARNAANRALEILTDPAAKRVALTGSASSNGALAVRPNGEAAIVVPRLAAAPSGKTYEAWVIANGKPVRAGTFPGGGGTAVLPLERDVPNGAQVAVTVEKKPGVDAPTTKIILATKPV